MQRRDFVKAIVAASTAAAAAPEALSQQTKAPVPQKLPPSKPRAAGPVPWSDGLLSIKPLPMTPLVPDAVAETNTHFFTTTQFATLRRLGELLMPPARGFPGSTEADTPEFLDFLVGSSPADRKQMYQSGLDRLESDAQRTFHHAFADTSAAEADQLIRPFLRAWMSERPSAEPFVLFINTAHTDIRTATTNSAAWADAALAKGQKAPGIDLYWYPVDPDLRYSTPASSS